MRHQLEPLRRVAHEVAARARSRRAARRSAAKSRPRAPARARAASATTSAGTSTAVGSRIERVQPEHPERVAQARRRPRRPRAGSASPPPTAAFSSLASPCSDGQRRRRVEVVGHRRVEREPPHPGRPSRCPRRRPRPPTSRSAWRCAASRGSARRPRPPARARARCSRSACGSWRPRRTRAASRGRARSSASRSRSTLPTDFDIFSSPSRSIPLCSQRRANGWAPARLALRALVLVVREHAGRAPPPCTSKPSPRCSRAIAEHSMCQPGRPGPHGRGPGDVLVGLRPLPEREVGRRLLGLAGLDAGAGDELVDALPRQLAVAVERRDAEVHVAPGGVGEPALARAPRSARRSGAPSRSRAARRRAARARAGRCPRCTPRGSAPASSREPTPSSRARR